MNSIEELTEVERIKAKPSANRTYKEQMILAHSPYGSASGCSVKHIVVDHPFQSSPDQRS